MHHCAPFLIRLFALQKSTFPPGEGLWNASMHSAERINPFPTQTGTPTKKLCHPERAQRVEGSVFLLPRHPERSRGGAMGALPVADKAT